MAGRTQVTIFSPGAILLLVLTFALALAIVCPSPVWAQSALASSVSSSSPVSADPVEYPENQQQTNGSQTGSAFDVYYAITQSPQITTSQSAKNNPDQRAYLDTSFGGHVVHGEHGEVSDKQDTYFTTGANWPAMVPGVVRQTDPRSFAAIKAVWEATKADDPTIGRNLLSGNVAATALAVAIQQGIARAEMPESIMPLAKEMQNQQNQVNADNFAAMARNQSAAAIDFIDNGLENFTVDATNKWNLLRDHLFIPMAILLLLPGAVLAQVKSIVSQGIGVLGDTNPFDGILRSIVAIFLIPGTYLIVNYGIDLSNSLSDAINSTYASAIASAPATNAQGQPTNGPDQGSNMYRDAVAAEVRAHPIRLPAENKNYVLNQVHNMGVAYTPANSPLAKLEQRSLATVIYDPVKDMRLVPPLRANELVPYYVNTQRALFNGMNAALTTTWTILCAFQMVYLTYLWFVGPIVAALWVWPIKQLRDAFPSWVEGVLTVCFWSLLWNTVILLMACFRGVDETGSVIMTALNFLATASVKFAFDFSGLAKAVGEEAGKMAQKAVKQQTEKKGGGLLGGLKKLGGELGKDALKGALGAATGGVGGALAGVAGGALSGIGDAVASTSIGSAIDSAASSISSGSSVAASVQSVASAAVSSAANSAAANLADKLKDIGGPPLSADALAARLNVGSNGKLEFDLGVNGGLLLGNSQFAGLAPSLSMHGGLGKGLDAQIISPDLKSVESKLGLSATGIGTGSHAAGEQGAEHQASSFLGKLKNVAEGAAEAEAQHLVAKGLANHPGAEPIVSAAAGVISSEAAASHMHGAAGIAGHILPEGAANGIMGQIAGSAADKLTHAGSDLAQVVPSSGQASTSQFVANLSEADLKHLNSLPSVVLPSSLAAIELLAAKHGLSAPPFAASSSEPAAVVSSVPVSAKPGGVEVKVGDMTIDGSSSGRSIHVAGEFKSGAGVTIEASAGFSPARVGGELKLGAIIDTGAAAGASGSRVDSGYGGSAGFTLGIARDAVMPVPPVGVNAPASGTNPMVLAAAQAANTYVQNMTNNSVLQAAAQAANTFVQNTTSNSVLQAAAQGANTFVQNTTNNSVLQAAAQGANTFVQNTTNNNVVQSMAQAANTFVQNTTSSTVLQTAALGANMYVQNIANNSVLQAAAQPASVVQNTITNTVQQVAYASSPQTAVQSSGEIKTVFTENISRIQNVEQAIQQASRAVVVETQLVRSQIIADGGVEYNGPTLGSVLGKGFQRKA
jgi:hypothetical protein